MRAGKRCEKFVLLSASLSELGGPAMGQIHEYPSLLPGVGFTVTSPSRLIQTKCHHGVLKQHKSLDSFD
jgi:festuclavine dehydrogenase